jgi:phenylacetate-coenzyme A ligase PaaK-like adenylate-forming protein
MLMSAAAQVRYAASVGLGLRFAPWSLDRLLDTVRDTHREFGQTGAEGVELLHGPELDQETRREMQLRRFRKQAVRAALETAYYEALFERLALDPGRLRHDDLLRIPLTRKEAVRDAPDAFVRRRAAPCFRTTTTGTTGKQTSVSFSAAEMRTFIALSAISFLAAGHIDPSDVVLLSTSSRAALGNSCFAGACARIGSLVSIGGLVEPADTLALLTEQRHMAGKKPRVSVMSTYPSYLGQLVEEGLRRGYRPADFGLERIVIGGELVSDGLQARSRRLFGPIHFDEAYAMTETWPLSGQRCAQGHLHFEPGQGLVEVVDPQTGAPVVPGEAGTIVATPFPPYRDTTMLLRYDTQDMARPITGPLTCNLRTMPATTNLLGKLRLSVRHDRGWTYPRDILEALEAMEEVPLPARFGFWAVPGGVAVEVVMRKTGPVIRDRIQRQLEERGVPVRELHLLEHQSRLLHPVPLRCDLLEASFAPLPEPARAADPSADTGLLRVGF